VTAVAMVANSSHPLARGGADGHRDNERRGCPARFLSQDLHCLAGAGIGLISHHGLMPLVGSLHCPSDSAGLGTGHADKTSRHREGAGRRTTASQPKRRAPARKHLV
jgi:hypothetical protein